MLPNNEENNEQTVRYWDSKKIVGRYVDGLKNQVDPESLA